MTRLLILVISTTFSAVSAATPVLLTTLTKTPQYQWRVNYAVSQPITRLAFQRSPDHSRATRWKVMSRGFIIEYRDDVESVTRRDGKAFKQVTFELTPTYTHLPKEYAPMSPFSDGGMLIYSGRFFACINQCNEHNNQWRMVVKATGQDKIIVGSTIYQQTAQWQDQDNGRVVYIGPNPLSPNGAFVGAIDHRLPATFRHNIDQTLPRVTDYFTRQLGRLKQQPAFYASFSPTDDGRYGHQGGVLPNQIFMHWYGQGAIDTFSVDDTTWFFAHEVAHLFQGQAGVIKNPKDAWIHEGSAEYFAGLATSDINPSSPLLQHKLAAARQQCLKTLQKNHQFTDAAASNYQLYYSCGLLLMHAIDKDHSADQSPRGLFDLWNIYSQKVAEGKTPSAAVFVEAIQPFLSASLAHQLKAFVNQADFDSYEFFANL